MTALQADGQRHRQRHRTRIAQPGERHKIAFRRQAQRLEHQLTMRDADLMAERAVDASAGCQFAASRKSRNVSTPVAMPSRINCSESVSISGCMPLPIGFVAAALAQLMKVRIGPHGRRQQTVARAAQFPVRQQHGTAGRSDRQRSDCRLDAAARQRDVAIQRFDGGLDQGRLLSVPSTRAARTWPSSIMFAACKMPFSSPRHAFDTSYTTQRRLSRKP